MMCKGEIVSQLTQPTPQKSTGTTTPHKSTGTTAWPALLQLVHHATEPTSTVRMFSTGFWV